MTPARAALAIVAVAAFGACSSSDSGGGPAVGITATQTACEVDRSQFAPGAQTFNVDNKGSEVTEVYVYAPGDKVVAEKEHIGPGTQARFTATLKAGTYEIACKPGETGNGIRQKITVE
jgi:iron uptake system component EfeO